MDEQEVELIEPTVAFREAFMDFVDEFTAKGESTSYAASGDVGCFDAYVAQMRDYADGVNVPDGLVPATEYWLVRRGQILGRCNLRHRLTDALRDFGGHVGYAVRPSQRNRGYASFMLRQMLAEAKRRGIRRVLVTCDKDNGPSARVIEKHGGKLDSESFSAQSKRITRRYWIDVDATAKDTDGS